MEEITLPAAFAPHISYFTTGLNKVNKIDFYSPFQKQTFRNRYLIATANGPLMLTIPVKKWKKNSPFKFIEISYAEKWQIVHERSITAAYKNTPYFEHIMDFLIPVYTNKNQYLHEISETSLRNIYKILGFTYQFSMSEILNTTELVKIDFEKIEIPENCYHQNFNDRQPFLKHCSIIDLLMNEGTESLNVLRKIKQWLHN